MSKPAGEFTLHLERVEGYAFVTRFDKQRFVTLHPEGTTAIDLAQCLNAFEDFCVVTQSVRDGVDVNVSVVGAGGA
jgi:hypothetical protein